MTVLVSLGVAFIPIEQLLVNTILGNIHKPLISKTLNSPLCYGLVILIH